MTAKRIKFVDVTPEALAEMFKDQSETYTTNMPEDAELVRIIGNGMTRTGMPTDTYRILFRSDEWELVEEGATIPQFTVVEER